MFTPRDVIQANTRVDFADFAGAPDPSPASIIPNQAQPVGAPGAEPTLGSPLVYTKWYRIWERTTPKDFITEAIILPFIIVILGLHIWGRRTNKAKAKAWLKAHRPALDKEYAQVGFVESKPRATEEDVPDATEKSQSDDFTIPSEVLKEKTAQEYVTYATGRQNVAFLDIRVLLFKRYNPATLLVEYFLSFIFDAMQAPTEKMEATAYSFDGRENDLVPARSQEQLEAIQAQSKAKSSVYDPFVWAVVHKEEMKHLRDDRYDISLTSTRDHAKLPLFATTMSESAEVTEQMLTPDLVKAIESAGDAFEYLIVTDQPLDKPQKLDETKSRKRLSLCLKLPSGASASAYDPTIPIFEYFLRLPDTLASNARFRPEVRRKIMATREAEQSQLRKADEEEKAEEGRLENEKKKKELRDGKLKGMSADEQRKFLEKERLKEGKRGEKKMMKKG